MGTGVAIAATNPGDQDPDFNGGQTRLVDFPAVPDFSSNTNDHATQVAVAPDGTIFVGGCNCTEGDAPVQLGHLDANGNPVAGFGTDGALTDEDHRFIAGPTAFGFAPNGDLLVGGAAYKSFEPLRARANDDSIDGDFTVYRYDASGTFKGQAREDFPFGGVYNSFIRGFMPLAEGGQLVMGSEGDGNYTNNHFATVTLNARDVITGESSDDHTQAAALAAGHQPAGPDGTYVIAGAGQTYTPPVTNDLRISAEQGDPAAAWVLRRYDANGRSDPSYGGDFPIAGANYVGGIDGSLAGDGATYLAGSVANGETSVGQIVRFTAEGQPDEVFGTRTVASIFGDEQGDGGPAYEIKAIAGTPDGKVIVVASYRPVDGNSETVVARLNTDGSLDTTFGVNGIRTLPGAAGADDMYGSDVAVQKDGKAVVAGDARREYSELALTRSARAAAGLADGERQAYVTRLAGDPAPPTTTTTTTTTTTAATTTTATTPTTTTTTTTTPAKPVAAQAAPVKVCSSKRAFSIRLRIPRGVKPLSATVKVNGKQVKVVKASRLKSKIDLRGLPKGTVKVSITVKLSGTKKSLKGQRTYHTCIPKRGDSIPVL